MDTLPDHRGAVRKKRKVDILLEQLPTGVYHEARMFNYSRDGMYFESNFAPLPGTEIYIGVEDSPYDSGPDIYRAQVRWRKSLSDKDSPFHYGVGVKYAQPVNAC